MFHNSKLLKPLKSKAKCKYPTERIPESSCATRETIDMDFFITSRNGNKKLYNLLQYNTEWNSQIRKSKNKEAKLVQLVQMYAYQSNTYREDLCWLHFKDE